MPVASDIILDQLAKDGYSLGEAGWIRPQGQRFYFEATAAGTAIDTSHERRIGRRRSLNLGC